MIEVFVDWLSGTFDGDGSAVRDVPGHLEEITGGQWCYTKPVNGYRDALELVSDNKVLCQFFYHGVTHARPQLLLTGSHLRAWPAATLNDLLPWLVGMGFRASRLDLSADFETSPEVIEDCISAVQEHEDWISRSWSCITSSAVRSNSDGRSYVLGRTLYLGSVKNSDQYIRVYDKSAEAMLSGLSSPSGGVVRVEAVFRFRRAAEAFGLVASGFARSVWIGRVRAYRIDCDWWRSLQAMDLESLSVAVSSTHDPLRYLLTTIVNMIVKLEKQGLPALSQLNRCVSKALMHIEK